MTSTVKLTETQIAVDWVGQFEIEHQATAIELLDAMTLVSHEEFMSGLRAQLIRRGQELTGVVGLYAERELRKWRGIPNRLFKEERRVPRRAFGAGPQPVQSTHAYDPEVGSEGLIANVVTQIRRELPAKYLSHPGPDQIRRRHVRTFALVTDFIGSGKRVCEYLDAAWRIASVKSWWSAGLLRFEVVGYAASAIGRKNVENHITKPLVTLVAGCPTIYTEFSDDNLDRIRDLCIDYDPRDRDEFDSLGFGGIGVLLAFAHGIPNNAPRLLHKSKRGGREPWNALFPARVTSNVNATFGRRSDNASIMQRLTRMGQIRLAEGPWVGEATESAKKMTLVLAALARGPRLEEIVARRTGLTLLEVRALINSAKALQWVDQRLRITDVGFNQLKHARSLREDLPLSNKPNTFYYPKLLRAPREPI